MSGHLWIGLAALFLIGLPARADDPKGFVALFDGKSLKGWKVHPQGTGAWTVKNGAIVSSGARSHLFSERGDFVDFHLRAEIKINDGGNSGQYFRADFGPGFPKGYEAQINSTHGDTLKTGSLCGFPQNRETHVKTAPIKPDTWFVQEVICRGNHIVIRLNGRTTVDFKDKDNIYRKGHFAFQQHHEGTTVQIRSVEVRELKD